MSSAEMSAAVPNHRRTKPGGIKTGVVTNSASGPTSQIPGLSQTADETSPVERSSGRRVGIFASDSEYVKLAKGGGHKGLLSHDADTDDQPMKAYNPPTWFGGDESKGGSKPTSPDSMMMASKQLLAAPFGTDNSSTWENDDRISPDNEMSPDGVANDMEGLSMTNKYKRTCHEKAALPVSMTKLLSHGYVANKKKSSTDDDDASSVTSEQTSTVMTEDVDELE
ncbi:uncharacterized protein C7orf57 homolog [Cyclopterus lumpus]|uniref:Uncharacterized protein n=1 Tax=Cyclopterus lumpus TaxID=8103 RepID=A0A8C2XTW3_CYCLU|nr:uncharacterized protein C7orf57 homolog [Cyclopterus lumpus]